MNDLSKMSSICHDCPYWEVCEPPYVCSATEAKYRYQPKEILIAEWTDEDGKLHKVARMLNN